MSMTLDENWNSKGLYFCKILSVYLRANMGGTLTPKGKFFL